FLFFEFLGIAGEKSSTGGLILWWLTLLGVSVFSDLTILHFRAFGAATLFRPNEAGITGWESFFRSPGSFVLTAFFAVNVVLALGFLMRYLRREIKWRSSVFNFGLLFLTLLLSGILFVRYYQFVRNMLL